MARTLTLGPLSLTIGKRAAASTPRPYRYGPSAGVVLADLRASGAWGFSREADKLAALQSFVGYTMTCARPVIEAIAQHASAFTLGRRDKPGEVIEESAAPIPYGALRNPNPIMSGYDLWSLAAAYLLLAGTAPLYKLRGALGQTVGLFPLAPNRVTVAADATDWVRYEFVNDGGKIERIPNADIVFLKLTHPSKPHDGLGVLQANKVYHDTEALVWAFQRQLFADGPDARRWMIEYPEDVTLSNDQQDEVAQAFAARLSDESTYSRREPLLLMAGAKAKPIDWNNRDLEVPVLNDELKERIRSAFRTSKPVIGEVEGYSRANVDGALVGFGTFAVAPPLVLIKAQLEKQLLPDWDARLVIDFPSPVPGDKEFALRAESARLSTQVVTINEVRAAEKLGDPVPWGDAPYDPYALPTSAATSTDDDKGGEGTAPAPDAAAALPAADVQKTALNGAQVAALQAIVESVGKGALAKPAAQILILLAFPSYTEAEVGAMLAAVEVKEPQPVPPALAAANAKPDEGADDDEEDDDEPRHERATKPAPMSREARYRAWAGLQSAAEAGTLRTLRRELVRQRDEVLARLEKDGPRALTMLASMGSRKRAEAYFSATRNPGFHTEDGVTVHGGPPRFGVTATNRTVADSIADQSAFKDSLPKALEKQLVQLYAGTGKAAAKQMGTAFEVDAAGIRKIANHLRKSTDSVLTTNFEAVRDALEEGFLAGEGVDDLAQRIRDIYDGISAGRARVIARTETVFPANQGALDGYGAAGVERVEWIATNDEATRNSHAAMDGKTVALGDDFKVPSYTTDSGRTVPGDTMQAPGGGSVAGQSINCRCTIGPVAPTNEDEGDDE